MKINYKYNKVKKNPCLVFIHGLGGNKNAWNEINLLAQKEDYSTLLVDLRGHGDSEKPQKTSEHQIEYFAQDIRKIIKKEKITDYILVGHCFGAIVAGYYEYKYRDAKALVMIATTYSAPKRVKLMFPFLFVLNNFLFNFVPTRETKTRQDFTIFKNTNDYHIGRIFSNIRETSMKSYLAILHQFAFYNGDEVVKRIKKPTLIISASNDRVFFKRYSERLNQLIKDSKWVNIPDANHILLLSHPKKVFKEIDKFIKSNKI